MQGPVNEDGSIEYTRRGLIPRTFEYLFSRIQEEERKGSGAITYYCKCAYVEIYNECIYDLLDGGGTVCTLREDAKKGGVYVEGCRDEIVNNPQDAFLVFERGSRNRHVAETAMNRESSRSHCVFTLFIQSKKLDGEVLDVRESRFNLVDLAGSERQQFSNTTGVRLKEAGNINKSLLALSNVINALVDLANGKPRHVHYRDSKLTFLLRDSLGGNAKTIIVAAVSPSALCQAETLSTLRFAQRAKQIRNKAVVNKDIQGNLLELQAEVRRLRNEILLLKASSGSGLIGGEPPMAIDVISDTREGGDAYFMLTVALERQAELLSELGRQQKHLDSQQELLRRKDQQINSEKMVAKFRDSTIKALNSKLSSNGVDDILEVFEAERAQHHATIAELKRMLEHHPEITRLTIESDALKERLASLDDHMRDVSRHEEIVGKHRKYEEKLAERLLQCERELAKHVGRTERAERTERVECVEGAERVESQCRVGSLDEIPIQQLSVTDGKHNEMEELEKRYQQLLDEHRALKEELDAGKESLVGKRKRKGNSIESLNTSKELIDGLNNQITNLQEKNDSLKKTITELRQIVKSEYENAAVQLRTKDERIAECELQISNLSNRLEEICVDRESLEATRDDLMAEIGQLQSALESSDADCRQTQEHLKQAQVELSSNCERLARMEVERADLCDRLSHYANFGSSKAITRQFEEYQSQVSELNGRVQELEISLKNLQIQKDALSAEHAELLASPVKEQLAIAEGTIVTLNQEMEGIQEELLKLRRENDKLIQHTNVKQKLQYHLQIKEENNMFREEIRALREELVRLEKRNIEMDEALHHQHQHHRGGGNK
jgi:kinesin family protein 15